MSARDVLRLLVDGYHATLEYLRLLSGRSDEHFARLNRLETLMEYIIEGKPIPPEKLTEYKKERDAFWAAQGRHAQRYGAPIWPELPVESPPKEGHKNGK
jgi:hypothetical protein